MYRTITIINQATRNYQCECGGKINMKRYGSTTEPVCMHCGCTSFGMVIRKN